jgi:Ser/Thr protein kinase RdoA (MazF antagonist)
MHLDAVLQHVLAQYPATQSREPPNFLGNHGGFSGARLWRVADGNLCLKAWPANSMPPGHLCNIHDLMRMGRMAGLEFVPEVLLTTDGRSVVEFADRLWDLTGWMPGLADYRNHPTRERLRAACVSLAVLHSIWGQRTTVECCPAVLRRMRAMVRWEELRSQDWRPATTLGNADPVRPWAERAWELVLRHMDALPSLLVPFTEQSVSTHPCLCDIWHDHVLYSGQEVSGVVDYGSTKRDHPAVDLARLLGSLVGDDEEAWATGLESYRLVRPLTAWEEHLARILDRTGTVLAAANWLRWLYHEGKHFDDRQAVAGRLEALVERMDSWVRLAI